MQALVPPGILCALSALCWIYLVFSASTRSKLSHITLPENELESEQDDVLDADVPWTVLRFR